MDWLDNATEKISKNMSTSLSSVPVSNPVVPSAPLVPPVPPVVPVQSAPVVDNTAAKNERRRKRNLGF
jgi:hypothetical protein